MSIPHYEAKMVAIQRRQCGWCAIGVAAGRYLPATELHHARVHASKWAKKKWPLFIDSLANLLGVDHGMHMERPGFGKWPESRVDAFERGLQRHPEHARRLNCE
jgi:hypothetical protein